MRRHGTYFALSLCLAALFPASALAVPPTVQSTTVTDVTATSATLKAVVNPKARPAAKYLFEYDTTRYNPSEGPHGTKTPEVNLPNVNAPLPAEAQIIGLSPGTTYHFRVVVSNLDGETKGPDRVLTTSFTPLPFGPCPNEEFRSGKLTHADKPSALLPDCRAYEQASPVLKHGLDTVGTYSTTKASPSGDAVTFVTSSGIPGGLGAQEPPLSLSTRGAGGWSTKGMLPPAESGQLAIVVGWTPDFAHVFSWAQLFGDPLTATLLDTPTAGGPPTEIYPYLPGTQPNFVGSSADGSKVFFEAFGIELVDGSAPAANNLYAWDRASKAIALVGALPDAECSPDPAPCAPDGGAVAGPYDWVNGDSGVPLTRGGGLSGYYTQEQHAVSTSGNRAYFTAAGGQLYLRENPLGPTPTTDHVSKSERTKGKGPNGTDSAGTQPAAFMAATPDGSKAFFTSSEKLTDDATTGPEPDKVAAIASADVDTGEGEDFEFLPARAKGITISGDHIYWADPSTSTIGRAKLEGSDPPSEIEENFIVVPEVKVETEEPGVFEEVPARPQYVAVDPAAEFVYWTNAPDEEELGQRLGTIGRAELDTGGPKEIDVEYITGASNPQGIAVNDEFIYWANNPPEGKEGNTPDIDEVRTIGRAEPGAVKGEEVNEKFIEVGEKSLELTPQGIAINATHIYMAIDGTQENSFVFRFDIEGQNRLILGDNQHKGKPGVRGIAVDAGHVYWAREGEDAIGRTNLNLDEASTDREWLKPADHPRGVAVDVGHVYWAANQEVVANPGNDLYRYDAEAPTGQRLTDLTVDTATPNGIEVRGVLGASTDGTRVYFVANGVPGGLVGSPNEQGESAAPGDCKKFLTSGAGTCNLYLWHDGTISFIARIEDVRNWTATPMARPQAANFQKTARLSADGQTLLFSSARQLTSSENEAGASELYRYRQDEGIVCVSCRPSGESPLGIETRQIFPTLTVPENPAVTLSRSLSANGNRVFFESTDALVSADTNGAGGCLPMGSALQLFPACQDVYEWEAEGTGSCKSDAQNGGCLSLISTGKSTYPSFFLDASESGDDVFIITLSSLVRQDIDQVLDVYDARVGGGLAGQNEVPDPCLSNPDCKPPQPPPPPPPPPVTKIPGGGNVKGQAKKPCPKSKKLVKKKGKTRCVAKKQKKRHGGKRRHGAGQSGRTDR